MDLQGGKDTRGHGQMPKDWASSLAFPETYLPGAFCWLCGLVGLPGSRFGVELIAFRTELPMPLP